MATAASQDSRLKTEAGQVGTRGFEFTPAHPVLAFTPRGPGLRTAEAQCRGEKPCLAKPQAAFHLLVVTRTNEGASCPMCLSLFWEAVRQCLRVWAVDLVSLGPPSDPTCLAVEPETVALSLQSPAGWWRHPLSGTVSGLKVIIHVNFLVPRLPLLNK